MSQEENRQSTTKTSRTEIKDLPRIEDLPSTVGLLTDAEAAQIAGGMMAGSCEPASCTFNNDTDWRRD